MSHEQGMVRVAKVAVAASLALFGVGLVSAPSAFAGGDLTADEVLNSRLVTRSIDSDVAGPVGGKVRCKADERLPDRRAPSGTSPGSHPTRPFRTRAT